MLGLLVGLTFQYSRYTQSFLDYSNLAKTFFTVHRYYSFKRNLNYDSYDSYVKVISTISIAHNYYLQREKFDNRQLVNTHVIFITTAIISCYEIPNQFYFDISHVIKEEFAAGNTFLFPCQSETQTVQHLQSQ